MCLGIESNVFEDGEQQSNFRSNAECEIGICNMLAKKEKSRGCNSSLWPCASVIGALRKDYRANG